VDARKTSGVTILSKIKGLVVIVAVVLSAYFGISMGNSIAAARAANAGLALGNQQAVVVGGTSGIGRGIAMRLAAAGASVTVVGRSKERGADVVRQMQEAATTHTSFDFVECNCFSLQNVSDVAGQLLSEKPSIDILVMSQGMATTQGFTATEEGLDQKLALHVWSRAAFASALLPALQRSEDGRVLSVLSAGDNFCELCVLLFSSSRRQPMQLSIRRLSCLRGGPLLSCSRSATSR